MIRQSEFLRRVLAEADKQGWTITQVDDGGDLFSVETIEGAVKAVEAVDIARIFLRKPAENEGWLYLVWQGPDEKYADGEEIVSDYTVNLESVMDEAYKAVANA